MKSLKTKILVPLCFLIISICLGFSAVSYFMSSRALEREAGNSLENLASQGAKIIQSRINEQFNALEVIASMDDISNPNVPLEEKLEILKKEVTRSGHIRIGIADVNGNMKATDGTVLDIKDRLHFIKPMAGERYVSDPIISKSDSSLVLSYGVPIKYNNKVVGVLVATRDGNDLSSIVHDITFGKTGKANVINSSGTIVAHENDEYVLNMDNITKKAEEDKTLKSWANIHNQMLEGEIGHGKYVQNGVTKLTGFAPVPDTNWFIAVEAPRSEILSSLGSLRMSIVILSIIFLFYGIISSILIATSVIKPIIRSANLLKVTATGDFTQPVYDKDLKRNDEIGLLANSIRTMQDSIRNLINSVVSETSSVAKSIETAASHMNALNSHIEEVSATTEELSAGMEETAAATEEMNATSQEIESAVDSIAEKAQDGASAAKQISRRAEELKSNAVASQQNAISIYSSTQEKLKNAIEHSKAVDRINVLSDTILQITSQTNLLALNAAIEAARAGESGKSFSVVADEIRKLAEDSKNAANEIQEVTKEVLDCVTNLSESSMELLNFIDKEVLNDYKMLVKTGDQYNKDAEFVDNMITDFSATSQQLAASIQNMIKAINEITSAANEGAAGTSDIAQKTGVIAQKASDILKQTNISKKSAEKLAELVSKFKV